MKVLIDGEHYYKLIGDILVCQYCAVTASSAAKTMENYGRRCLR